MDASADAAVSCSPGQEDCACRAAGSPCALGLSCVDDVCEACPEGTEGCDCRTSGDACDSALACEDRRCVSCEAGTEGCDCGAGCGDGLLCASDRCRVPASCDALREAGECAVGRACTLSGGVPTCLDTCEANFRVEAGVCVMCPAAGCDEESCADLDCATRNRTCAEGPDGPSCGGCADGFREDASLSCVDERLCGGSLCPDGEIPLRDGETCECVTAPCPDGQARTAAGTCVSCGITCGGVEGETGALHPLTAGLACMCETLEGYFVPPGEDGRARACDDDEDGWVGTTALTSMESPDLGVSSNARCVVQTASEVTLSNEYGQTLSLRPCADGLLADHAGVGASVCNDFGGVAPILLVEPDRNDRQAVLEAEATGPTAAAPAYGARAFRADELNALTRACVSEHADYNADGVPDLLEWQGSPSAAFDNEGRLAALSFFTELHTASFVADPLGGDGTLSIVESSRCAGGFPLNYGTLDGGSDQWQGCHRQRDQRFGLPSAPPGLDFGAYSCDASVGACPMLPPPATGRAREECPNGGACHATAPFHDVCEPGLEWGPVWRGMHHHSQFRCTLVDDGSTASHAAPQAAIGEDGHLAFSQCSLGSAGFTCPPSSATGVGWAALRYAPAVTVELAPGEPVSMPTVRGCVDEAATLFEGVPWSVSLCPSPTDPAVTLEDDFGRLDCPCSETEFSCDDGEDNNCDGLIDCEDPACDRRACGGGLICGFGACACVASELNCRNGDDDDCDGLADCEDPDCDGRSCGPNGLTCADTSVCRCTSTSELCNGADTDCDGIPDDGCPVDVIVTSPRETLPRHGPASGNTRTRSCTANQVMVGMDVRSGSLVDRVVAICADVSLFEDTTSSPEYAYEVRPGTRNSLPEVTTNILGPDNTALRCPANTLPDGIITFTGSRLDRIGFRCRAFSFVRGPGGGWEVQLGDIETTPLAGDGGATLNFDACPTGMAIDRLVFRVDSNDIYAVTASCSTVTPSLR